MNYSATIEFLTGQKAAIVTLFDQSGEWSGSSRIEPRSGSRADLYEQGYTHASCSATLKGGWLDRYSVAGTPSDKPTKPCRSLLEPSLERRRVNGLNIEIGTPLLRCSRKSPDGRGLAWLLSGGSMLAYGHCNPNICPESHV